MWIAALTAGFISVGYAWLFKQAEHLFLQGMGSVGPEFGFIFTPLLFFFAWYIARRFSPEAGGSGIPQIMAASEMEYAGVGRKRVDRLLSLRTAAVKIASSLLCILGGGAIGREGPTIHICTSLFHFVGKRVRGFIPETPEKMWVVAGAAAGLASAFNTPLGGIVYAIEELGISHFHKVRSALISAVIITGLVSQWILGSYLYLGFPQIREIGYSFLPVAILTGVLCGLMGSIFGHILFLLMGARAKIKSQRVATLITISCGLLMAVFFIYSTKAAGSGEDLLANLLFHGEKSSLSLISFRFIGTIVSYMSGAAGGLFSPSLAVGATIGSWLSDLFNVPYSNLMVLLGMTGFLTGVTRTPFTAFILVLEMTDRHSAIFPMMLAALAAQWAAHITDSHSFYEHIKEKWMVKDESIG